MREKRAKRSNGEGHDKARSVRFQEELWEAIQAASCYSNIEPSEWIRRCCRASLTLAGVLKNTPTNVPCVPAKTLRSKALAGFERSEKTGGAPSCEA